MTNLPAPPAGAQPARGGNAPAPPVPPVPVAAERIRRSGLTPTSPNGTQYAANADGETGRFDFPKVIAGGYVAYLFADGMTVRTSVEVRNGDVDGLALPISSGIDIPVNVTFEGTPPQNMPSVVNLIPTLWRNPTLLGAPLNARDCRQSACSSEYRAGQLPRLSESLLLGPLRGLTPVDAPAGMARRLCEIDAHGRR